MRLSCALKTEEKKLKMHLEPGELFCLAELLMQKSDLRGLLVYGMVSAQWVICACKGGIVLSKTQQVLAFVGIDAHASSCIYLSPVSSLLI